MRTQKLLFAFCAFALSLITFASCGGDDDLPSSGGSSSTSLTGTYATSGEYDNYTGKTFRDFIVVKKSSVTTYTSMAVQDKSYWGSGSFVVPGSGSWYVEKGSARSYGYIKVDNNIVLDNGSLYTVGTGTLVHGGKTYYKY